MCLLDTINGVKLEVTPKLIIITVPSLILSVA